MILSDEELRALTTRSTRPAQRRMLDALGIKYAMRADASIVVLRAHAEAVLGGTAPTKARKKIEPNWSAINGPAQKTPA